MCRKLFKTKHFFNHKYVVKCFIFYELNIMSYELNTDFKLKKFLFKNLKLPKNINPDKYHYSGYNGIGFDPLLLF